MQGFCENCCQYGFIFKTSHLCETCHHDLVEED